MHFNLLMLLVYLKERRGREWKGKARRARGHSRSSAYVEVEILECWSGFGFASSSKDRVQLWNVNGVFSIFVRRWAS